MPSRDVVVRFVGDTGNLTRSTDQVSGRLRGVATSLDGVAKLGGLLAGVSFFGTMISEARDAERTGKQTEAVLRSTGGAANLTAKQIGDLASKLSEKTAVDDEVIQHGENVLLTFKNVRDEAGKGNDVFSQTTQIALDMSAALSENGDASEGLQGNMVKLGKALNDPIKGISALTKVGVTFTDQQKVQIAQMVHSGDIMGAQKLILQELQSEFGGMAEASADSVGKAKVAWGNFAEEVGQKVMPAVNAVSNWALTTGIPTLGHIASVVGDVLTPVVHAAAAAAGGLVGVWQSLPGPIQAGAVALGVWALAGDKVTGFLSRSAGPLKNFGSDVKTAMGAFDAGRLNATMMVMEERVPVIGQMGAAFRGAKGDVSGFASTVKGVGAASLTGFKSAASGLVGFLGGGWGVAFAAAAVAVGWLTQKSAEAEAKQREFIETGRRLNDVLQENSNIINGNVRMQLNKIAAEERGENSGRNMLQIAKDMQISYQDLNDALAGNVDAFERVRSRLQQHGVDARGAITRNSEEARTAQDLYNWLGAVNEGRIQDASSAKAQAEANQAVAGATTNASAATAAATGVTEEATTAIDEQKRAVDELLNSYREYWGESAAAVDDQIAWQQQWDDLSAAISANGTSLDINTEKGRNNAGALTDLIKTSQDMMLQDIKSGIAVDVASGKHVKRTNALIAEAKRTGMNTQQVANLIAKYNGVPSNITTWLSQKGLGPVRQNLAWLTAVQTLLKDGIEATPAAINMRMRKATGYTSSGKEDYAGGRASGGLIRGPGSRTSDTAGVFRLSDMEFVQQAAATDYYGVPFMNALNDRKIPREMLPGYARGGLVAPYPVNVSKTFIPTQAQVEAAFMAKNNIAVGAAAAGSPAVVAAVRAVAARFGWGSGAQWNALSQLIAHESGWNPAAANPSSSARGLFQKLTSVNGPVESTVGGQAQWGLNYIRGRYGSPAAAWSAWLSRSPHWYKDGGWLQPGGLGYNETSKPEAVLNSSQWDKIDRLVSALEKGEFGGKHYHFSPHVSNHPVDVAQQFRRLELLGGMP